MTSNDKFERWWATHEIECIPAHALSQVEYELFKNAARTAWNAHADRYAALTPEVIETLIEACDVARDAAAEAELSVHEEKYEAARAALESLK